jgi:hypothetical protein
MNARKYYPILLIILAVALVSIAANWVSSTVLASPLPQDESPSGVPIPYAGSLVDEEGFPVEDGAYDFSFAIYDADTGGALLWTGIQEDISVRDGDFVANLVASNEILAVEQLWLEIGVRGSEDPGFTLLAPRQQLSAYSPTEPDSPTAGIACPHDHFGEVWTGDIAWSNGGFKVLNYGNGPSIWGWNGGNGNGIRGYATGTGLGVYGESQDAAGVAGRSIGGNGVEGYSTTRYGIFAHSDNSDGLYVDGAGNNGVHVASAGDHGVYVASAGWSGVSVGSASVAGVWVASAGQDGVLVSTAGWDGFHVVGPVGGSYYGSGLQGEEDFLVLNTGEVRSKVGFATPSSGFAQILPVSGLMSDYETGDVIVMGTLLGNGRVEQAAVPNSPTVIGVYAESPGFLSGQPVPKDEAALGIPVTIMGIVPVKVSAENGPIQAGDLLVTSSTPGHAMRADNPQPGTILGKALESLDEGTGIIQVLLMLQ